MKYSQKTYEHAPASLAEKADRDVSDPMPLTRDPLRRMVCRNCGECQTVWGWAANSLFMRVFRWFWNGKFTLTNPKSADILKHHQNGQRGMEKKPKPPR